MNQNFALCLCFKKVFLDRLSRFSRPPCSNVSQNVSPTVCERDEQIKLQSIFLFNTSPLFFSLKKSQTFPRNIVRFTYIYTCLCQYFLFPLFFFSSLAQEMRLFFWVKFYFGRKRSFFFSTPILHKSQTALFHVVFPRERNKHIEGKFSKISFIENEIFNLFGLPNGLSIDQFSFLYHFTSISITFHKDFNLFYLKK